MDINIPTDILTLIIVLLLWDLAWKGLALWRASERKDKVWFGIILLVNSVGLLPIIYLLLTKDSRRKS